MGGALFVLATTAVIGAQSAVAQPSAAALADIPPELLALYQDAAEATCGMRWEVLAAVGKTETDHGRSALPGVRSGANSAGAMGPMQFLAGTWAAYGVDADGDGDRDVYDPVDAIWGAANYLCANGVGDPQRERQALWAYNHDYAYVDHVLAVAAGYAAAGVVGTGDAAALLNNPNVALSPRARQDLVAGVVDQRLINFLAWAAQRHHIAVSVIKSGHAQFVSGTNRVSNHWYGRGADIFAVDGEEVSRGSPAARALALEAIALSPPGRPTEIGLPWPDLVQPGVFSDGDHQGHLHVGWRQNPPAFT